MSMPPNPLLEDQLADPLWERFLHRSTSNLARASRPDFLGDEPTPLQWVAEDWDRLEAERCDIFDWDKLRSSSRPRRLFARWIRCAAGRCTPVRH